MSTATSKFGYHILSTHSNPFHTQVFFVDATLRATPQPHITTPIQYMCLIKINNQIRACLL